MMGTISRAGDAPRVGHPPLTAEAAFVSVLASTANDCGRKDLAAGPPWEFPITRSAHPKSCHGPARGDRADLVAFSTGACIG